MIGYAPQLVKVTLNMKCAWKVRRVERIYLPAGQTDERQSHCINGVGHLICRLCRDF